MEDDASTNAANAKGFGQGFVSSWRIYFRHEMRNAGIGFAFLYMTVLGFDSITTGYAYSQGVPESILGILLAVGAGVGLLGSVAFPTFVRFLGVARTGNLHLFYFMNNTHVQVNDRNLKRLGKSKRQIIVYPARFKLEWEGFGGP